MKAWLLSIALGLGATGSAGAQSSTPDSRGPPAQIRDPYVTSTGATVDKPGMPQSSGNTAVDRKIQREDNKIDAGICKGC